MEVCMGKIYGNLKNPTLGEEPWTQESKSFFWQYFLTTLQSVFAPLTQFL